MGEAQSGRMPIRGPVGPYVRSLEGGPWVCLCGGPELCTFRMAALLMKHLHLRK